ILCAPTDRMPAAVLGFLALLLMTAPLYHAFRLTRALRVGRMDFAVVESVEYSGPGARDTLDSIKNGIARGKWRIRETSLLDFEVDEPWAKELRRGSRVEVLVAGSTGAKAFPLGP